MRIMIEHRHAICCNAGIGLQSGHEIIQSNFHRRQGVLWPQVSPSTMALSIKFGEVNKSVGVEEVARSAVAIIVKLLHHLPQQVRSVGNNAVYPKLHEFEHARFVIDSPSDNGI